MRFDPQGQWLAASTVGGEWRLWDLRLPHAPSRLLLDRTSAANALAFGGNGNLLAASSEDGTVRIWQLASIDARLRLMKVGEGLARIALSHDGGRLAAGNPDRDSASMWALSKGSLVWSRQLGEDAGISAIGFVLGDRMLGVGISVVVRLSGTGSGRFVAQPLDAARFFAFTANGEWLVAMMHSE